MLPGLDDLAAVVAARMGGHDALRVEDAHLTVAGHTLRVRCTSVAGTE